MAGMEYSVEEIDEFIDSSEINLDVFINKTILVTGATGFIGSQLTWFLIRLFFILKSNSKIYLLVRNELKAKELFSSYPNCIVITSLESIDDKQVDFIFHTASVTSSQVMVDCPVETIKTSVLMTDDMLNFARSHLSKMVYLSSMEVFGKVTKGVGKLKEDEYGYLDVLSSRSSYPESKRLCECLCHAYAVEYDVDVSVARLCQIFGPGVKYNDSRIMSEFCRCVVEKRDIVLKTSGESVRNCCYIWDAVLAILVLAIKGQKGESYNVANKDICLSIKENAEFLCAKFPEIRLRFEITNTNKFPPLSKLSLDTSKLEDLGWSAKIGLNDMFERSIKYFSRLKNEKI